MADYNNLFQLDSAYKQLTISVVGEQTEFTNEDLYSEKFELYEGICAESELRFGECVASSVKFTISNTNVSLIGKTINVSISINEEEPFIIGTYIVDSDKPTSDKRYRDVVAYDAMYGIINKNVSAWYTTFFSGTGTKTLKQFRDSFFTEVGVQQVSVTLPQDSIAVEETIGGDDISGKTIINAICEINGCFGHINRSGQFDYVFLRPASRGLYPSDTLCPGWGLTPSDGNVKDIDRSLYMTAEYEDYSVLPITKLQIRQSENDIGCIVGSGDNMYIVEDNILVYGKDSTELTTIATTLYNQIDNITYIPANVKAKGNLTINVGDGIYLDTTYKEIITYVLERTLTGIQSLKDNFVSQGEEYQSENINSVNRSIIQLKGKTNELTRTIEETQSTIIDVERGLQSQITQNAEQISLKVTKGDVSSEISQEAGQITISSNRLIINSDYFKLNAQGVINCTGGTIGGFTIGANTLSATGQDYGVVIRSGSGNVFSVGDGGAGDPFKLTINTQGALDAYSVNAQNLRLNGELIFKSNSIGGIQSLFSGTPTITSGTVFSTQPSTSYRSSVTGYVFTIQPTFKTIYGFSSQPTLYTVTGDVLYV
jgi:prefoldin subunit 5